MEAKIGDALTRENARVGMGINAHAEAPPPSHTFTINATGPIASDEALRQLAANMSAIARSQRPATAWERHMTAADCLPSGIPLPGGHSLRVTLAERAAYGTHLSVTCTCHTTRTGALEMTDYEALACGSREKVRAELVRSAVAMHSMAAVSAEDDYNDPESTLPDNAILHFECGHSAEFCGVIWNEHDENGNPAIGSECGHEVSSGGPLCYSRLVHISYPVTEPDPAPPAKASRCRHGYAECTRCDYDARFTARATNAAHMTARDGVRARGGREWMVEVSGLPVMWSTASGLWTVDNTPRLAKPVDRDAAWRTRLEAAGFKVTE